MVSQRPLCSRPLGAAAALILAAAVLATLAIASRSLTATAAARQPSTDPLRHSTPHHEHEPLPARMDRYVRLIPPRQHWYAANGARTACHESGSPLALLAALGHTHLEDSSPRVKVHWRDWFTVEKVQVEVARKALPARRLEFYSTRPACEAATAQNRRLADSRR